VGARHPSLGSVARDCSAGSCLRVR
jgi:hypothetical protein